MIMVRSSREGPGAVSPLDGSRYRDAMSVVDIAAKLAQVTEHWSPKVVARLNDYEIKVVTLEGEFVWHSHAETDELFLVVSGTLTIQLRDGDVTLGAGQLYVVPRGVEHCPRSDGEVQAVLIEPAGVVNTGDAGGPLTARYDDSMLR
jgi:mannose-6-phosphate isomerase-like protein (cupin superfamily)